MKKPKDTATETGRDDDETEIEIDESTEPFEPDDAFVAELEKQLTPKLIDSLRNYARSRAFMVACAGRKVDDYYARELVQDAIGDTWTGLLRWDPERWTLEYHLIRAIQGRTSKHCDHAVKNPHDSLGENTEQSQLAEADASELVADSQHAVQRVYSHETIEQIRVEAAGDKPVLRVLDAYDAGALTKDDVLAFTKMKARTYHNAHIRLKRIVRKLTDPKLAAKSRA